MRQTMQDRLAAASGDRKTIHDVPARTDGWPPVPPDPPVIAPPVCRAIEPAAQSSPRNLIQSLAATRHPIAFIAVILMFLLLLIELSPNARCYYCGHEFHLPNQYRGSVAATCRYASCPHCTIEAPMAIYFTTYNRAHKGQSKAPLPVQKLLGSDWP